MQQVSNIVIYNRMQYLSGVFMIKHHRMPYIITESKPLKIRRICAHIMVKYFLKNDLYLKVPFQVTSQWKYLIN